MITLEPSWDEIDVLPTPLTAGERRFIERIEELFGQDDRRHLEVFVQANINADRPDIIVTERGAGIWIIEVKDWNLAAYSVVGGKWYVKSGGKNQIIKSPFQQAERYKKNIYSLHSHYLANRKIGNPGLYGMVRCGVYFHCAEEAEATNFRKREFGANERGRFFEVFGFNSSNQKIHDFFKPPNTRIQDLEYHHLMRFIRASEEARPLRKIIYSPKQLSLIKSSPKRQKIKGVAGAGKSLVLAARAVDALRRTNGKILIITFNITLMNYIHDRISEARGMYRRKDFNIMSYHAYINAECNNYGIPTDIQGDFDSKEAYYQDIGLFESCKNMIEKYDAIFIDEVQDFKYEWQLILANYFLKENGELVLFGDEKQNIYKRELENKKIRTIIPGAWNILSESYRLSKKTTELADAYQKNFFLNRYEIDELQFQLEFDLTTDLDDQLHYFYSQNSLEVLSRIEAFITQHSIHPNDIVFLGSNKATMRNIDSVIRQKGERTTTMFTSLEEYTRLLNERPYELKQIDAEIERARKVNFWMNEGCVKVSTIQSFKGWEANTVILIIPSNTRASIEIEELIYTGLTRSKKNLIIINEENSIMHDFFSKEKDVFDTFNVF